MGWKELDSFNFLANKFFFLFSFFFLYANIFYNSDSKLSSVAHQNMYHTDQKISDLCSKECFKNKLILLRINLCSIIHSSFHCISEHVTIEISKTCTEYRPLLYLTPTDMCHFTSAFRDLNCASYTFATEKFLRKLE